MNELLEWLLKGEPFVEYRTRVDLLKQSEKEPQVLRARKEMINHPRIQLLFEELRDWPGIVLNSHKSGSQPVHKLSFVADLGLTKYDPDINVIVKKVLEHKIRGRTSSASNKCS